MVSLNFLNEQAMDKNEELTEIINNPESHYNLEEKQAKDDNSDFSILYIIFSALPMIILLILFSL
ncbi:hypothetical protein Ccar_08220 [Clostridium carboxidivorans P7]|uniref:Uncharacterized protein n=1 Tax=Clostridium carboxidivorans P7 TaxID=536227 RepID=C6Q222_9CLOT|nr:hypothetical protein [Clostridium carboxidivorans]AKN30823.1 hypothetical protein Ccar_08220 [Clostridium carboxidivorans P7]EET84467.1 hypothetical protein CcarbDRAFT_5090 [Clostridium carboxidivorans P7]EFG88929.1 hypothetical protein CLCAR_1679 [Clostridium carboxidivorans P7]